MRARHAFFRTAMTASTAAPDVSQRRRIGIQQMVDFELGHGRQTAGMAATISSGRAYHDGETLILGAVLRVDFRAWAASVSGVPTVDVEDVTCDEYSHRGTYWHRGTLAAGSHSAAARAAELSVAKRPTPAKMFARLGRGAIEPISGSCRSRKIIAVFHIGLRCDRGWQSSLAAAISINGSYAGL